MPYKVKFIRKVHFQRPTVGPKHYITVGASHWAEMFPRADADKQLEAYIGAVALPELVDCFVQEMSVDDKAASWSDVMKYLARVFNVKAEEIPMTIGVAFWGHVVLVEDAKGKN